MTEEYMRMALQAAGEAESFDEVPVGAVIVKNDKVIAVAGNRKERDNCAVQHAEIVAISEACRVLDNWYLEGCEMYVTLEPCPMCAGAIINSRIEKVYYGARDPKSGCCGSLYNLLADSRFNHNPTVAGGILERECGEMLSEYFRKKRREKRAKKQSKDDNID